VIYEIIRALLDSIIKWASTPSVVRVVGGGARVAERVRAAIRARTRQSDVDSRSEGKRARGDA
jgi:hypothetical protein